MLKAIMPPNSPVQAQRSSYVTITPRFISHNYVNQENLQLNNPVFRTLSNHGEPTIKEKKD